MPAGGWQQPTPTSGTGEGNAPAIVGLVLGSLGLLITVISFGFLGFLGIVLGIPAIVLGVIGRRKVDRGETSQHRGLATGGLWTGIIATVLGLLAVIVLVLLGTLIGSSTDLQQQIEEQQRQLQQQQ